MSEELFGAQDQLPASAPDSDFDFGMDPGQPVSDDDPPAVASVGEDSPAPASNRRLFIVAALGMLVIILIGVVVVLMVVRSRISRPAPAVKTTATATVVARPTVTPPPTAAPVPTMVAVQITVDGPNQYASGDMPYLVEYKLNLVRGDPVTVTVTCPKCLWPAAAAQGQTQVQLTQGVVSTVRVGTMGGELDLAVLGNGNSECLQWKLAPGDNEKPFRGICVPTP